MDITESIHPDESVAVTGLDIRPDLSVSRSQQDQQKLADVARKFEGLLLHQMFKQAKEGLETLKEEDGEDESSDNCQEQFQSLFWSQMADAVSRQGGIGLYKTFYTQLQQDVKNTENPGSLLNEGV